MRSLFALFGTLLVATSNHAESLPTFHVGHSSRTATHIVLVKTDDAGKGKFRVVESWKGDLKPDAALSIPGLAKDAKGDMVLFLKRDSKPEEGDEWKPAGIGSEWRVAVAWLDGDTVSAVEQLNNPGPAEVMPIDYIKSRKAFRQMVDYYVNSDRAFDTARAIKDPQKRVDAFSAIINGQNNRKEEAFSELGQCGPKAVPVLRKVLESKPNHDHKYAVPALAQAGGRDVVPELAKMIDAEVTWWADAGPKLKKGWWFNTDCEAWKRHGRLWALVEVCRTYPTTELRKQVVAVRDLMRNLPTVDADKGIGSMSAHCEEVLKEGD
ncbi:MAG TPA: hypothetical protein VKD71_09950 [Gemmataceae bacterium]|nr:hypothetical protein [Gemmataceae bacterium]